MPVLGRPGACVLDLLGPGELAIELLAGADAADRPLPDASVDEHAAPALRHRSEELLMMDGLELRQSRTRASAHLAAPQHREARRARYRAGPVRQIARHPSRPPAEAARPFHHAAPMAAA